MKMKIKTNAAAKSKEAQHHPNADTIDLIGDVLIDSTTGYRIRSDQLIARLSRVDVTSPGEVNGVGPAGTLKAGKMRITADESGKNVQMLFTNGVKLLYDPKETDN